MKMLLLLLYASTQGFYPFFGHFAQTFIETLHSNVVILRLLLYATVTFLLLVNRDLVHGFAFAHYSFM